MKHKKRKTIVGLMAIFLSLSAVQAAETAMNVHGASVQSEALSKIQRLTFADGNLLIKTAEGETPVALAGIDKITFGEVIITDIKTSATNADIALYPVPATNELKFESGNLKIDNVQIIDLFGKTVFNSHLPTLNSINVSALPAGIYIININTPDGIISKKIIKQ